MDNRDELLTAFGIGPEDLAANRAGRLGPRQRRDLERRIVARAGVTVVAIAPLLVLAYIGPLWTKVAVVALVMLVAVAVVVRVEQQIRAARQPGVVACLSGAVTPALLFRQNAGWWLTVQGRSFRAPIDVTHIDEETGYQVYYLPAAHRIVAIEPLEKTPEHPSIVDNQDS